MNDFNAALNDALRYSMDNATNLVQQLASDEHRQTRWGHPDRSDWRGIASDALRDADRHTEADLLADPKQHVMVVDGKVRPAKFDFKPVSLAVNDVAGTAHKAYGGNYGDHFYGLYHDAVEGDPSSHRVWTNSNPSNDPTGTVVHVSQLGDIFADDAERDLRHNRTELHPDVITALENLRNAPYEVIDHSHPSEQHK